MKAKFSGVAFVVYPVRDMARARRFYGGVLGLRPGRRWKNLWVEYEAGRQVIALATGLAGHRPGARGAAAALETARFDEVVAHLRRRRVRFLFGPTDTGVCDFARFADPEGNPLILHRRHRRRRK